MLKQANMIGLVASVVGLLAFTLNWLCLDIIHVPLPGYQILLYPGNLTLVYLWHPLFSEEIDLLEKLSLLLLGQFLLVTLISYGFLLIRQRRK